MGWRRERTLTYPAIAYGSWETKRIYNRIGSNNTDKALLQHAKLSKANTDLVKEKEKLEKKYKVADKKLEDITVNNEKIEQLKKDNTLNITTLSSCEQHIEKLQGELKEARELAVQLQ